MTRVLATTAVLFQNTTALESVILSTSTDWGIVPDGVAARPSKIRASSEKIPKMATSPPTSKNASTVGILNPLFISTFQCVKDIKIKSRFERFGHFFLN